MMWVRSLVGELRYHLPPSAAKRKKKKKKARQSLLIGRWSPWCSQHPAEKALVLPPATSPLHRLPPQDGEGGAGRGILVTSSGTESPGICEKLVRHRVVLSPIFSFFHSFPQTGPVNPRLCYTYWFWQLKLICQMLWSSLATGLLTLSVQSASLIENLCASNWFRVL